MRNKKPLFYLLAFLLAVGEVFLATCGIGFLAIVVGIGIDHLPRVDFAALHAPAPAVVRAFGPNAQAGFVGKGVVR